MAPGHGQRGARRHHHVPGRHRHPHDACAVQDLSQLYTAVARARSIGPSARRRRCRTCTRPSGSLLALAALARLPSYPDVPTVAEAGGPKDFELKTWVAAFVPKGTPAPVRKQLNEGIAAAVQSPAVLKRFETFGFRPGPPAPPSCRRRARRIRRASRSGQEGQYLAGLSHAIGAGVIRPRRATAGGSTSFAAVQQHHQLQVRMRGQSKGDLLERQLAAARVLEFTQSSSRSTTACRVHQWANTGLWRFSASASASTAGSSRCAPASARNSATTRRARCSQSTTSSRAAGSRKI